VSAKVSFPRVTRYEAYIWSGPRHVIQCSGKTPYQVVVLLACIYFDEVSEGGTARTTKERQREKQIERC
jgi:hypothetical protein